MRPANKLGRVIAFPRDNPEDASRSTQHKEDPYVATKKPPAPAVCPTCKAVFNEGRWTWQRPPADAGPQATTCLPRVHASVSPAVSQRLPR